MIYMRNKKTGQHRVPKIGDAWDLNEWELIQADADGWIDWSGDDVADAPLPVNCAHEIKLYNGSVFERKCPTGTNWASDTSVIAYRPIIKPQGEQQKEWNGEWLPPVGTVCEVNYAAKWRECEIIGHFKQRSEMVAAFTVAYNDGAKTLDSFVADCFRPILTDRERWIEEAHKIVEQKRDLETWRDTLGRIYDAGLAKMPGE